MLTNVKTSSSRENKNLDGDVFVLIKRLILKGVFVFGSKGFVAICYYTLSNKVVFFTKPFGPLQMNFSLKKYQIFDLLFKSSYKLCTPILAILSLNASTAPPKTIKKSHISERQSVSAVFYAEPQLGPGLPLPLAGLADQSCNLPIATSLL